MPCYHPLQAWRARVPNSATGKTPIVFAPENGDTDQPIMVGCGQCIGCRLKRSRDWALRCLHENSLHDQSTFITLTYDDDHLPSDKSLNKRDWQLFMKRLRKSLPNKTIRFYMAGEYGTNQDITSLDTIGRPHYHAILFGHDFMDKEVHSENHNGDLIYTSKNLENIWPWGFNTIGDVTFESAAYVARYCTKKITGPEADDHYNHLDTFTGEYVKRMPEFNLCSLRPGIAASWYRKYHSDLDKGFVTHKGIKHPIPPYYDKLIERHNLELYEKLKTQRVESIDPMHPDLTPKRLADREKVKLIRTKTLKRNKQ